jgi:hypothetical protein
MNSPSRLHAAWALVLLLVAGGASTRAQVASGPASALDGAPDPSKVFATEALRADVQAMMETFEAVHPDLYHATSRRAARRRVAALLDSLDRPMTRRAFYVATARLAASFGDGHTRVALPKEAFAFAARSGKRVFPATVRPATRGLAVDRWCGDDTLPDGARLLAVNDRDAAELFDTVQAVLPGAPAYRRAAAGEQFPYLLWAHGVDAPYRLTYAVPGGDTATVVVEGADFEQVRGCLSPRAEAPFSFERRAVDGQGDVGVLTLRRLRHPRRFRRFLAAVADSLARRPVRGLVLDLRDNEGGRTRVAKMMLSALTDAPVRLTARKDWKVSRPFKDYLRRTTTSSAYDAYLDRRPGKVLEIDYAEEPLPDVPLKVDAPVAVLIGPRTFSSAVTLAAAMQAYDLGVLVGEETGGRANRFGEGYPFRLPNTGLRVMVSSAYFIQASGRERSRGGVQPDVPVAAPVGVESDLAMGVAVRLMGRWKRED